MVISSTNIIRLQSPLVITRTFIIASRGQHTVGVLRSRGHGGGGGGPRAVGAQAVPSAQSHLE